MPSQGIVFSAPNGKSIDVPFHKSKAIGNQSVGFVSKRLVFDKFLFEKANSTFVTIFQQVTITSVDKILKGYRITYNLLHGETIVVECSIVIGADGDKGITRKKLLNCNAVGKKSAIGLRAYYKGVTDMHAENFFELHFLKEVLPGYL